MKCSNEQCAEVTEYTDDEYTLLAVFRGVIIGKISRLTIAPRRNCFTQILDGRYLNLPDNASCAEDIQTTGHITFQKYNYHLHLCLAKERSNEVPVKFDTIIAKDDKVIVITGTRPQIKDMALLREGVSYRFCGNEEYHACNHCEER